MLEYYASLKVQASNPNEFKQFDSYDPSNQADYTYKVTFDQDRNEIFDDWLLKNNECEGLSEFKNDINPFELPERMDNNMLYLEMYPISLTEQSNYNENRDAGLT